ncbi:MAG: LacI family DNA-binding transcriptional regulator [Oscillospiraceae bacterium]|nr:LacI family DNA-binding transcriptional regulator [Oscillospiraceae bacterium]
MSKQEANIYEIAKEAGVSIATVSRVMNRSASVSEKSTKKVMDAVRKLNYVPNSTARSLSTSLSRSIGIVVPDINNPFFSKILQGVTAAADEQGLQVVLYSTDEDTERELKVLHTMREHRLRGIIITPVSEHCKETLDLLQDFELRGIPVVLVDREVDDPHFDRVVAQDEDGVYQAVCSMLQAGHKRVAIVTGPLHSRPGKERLRGYERALEDFGIPLRQEYIRQGDFRMERACEETLELCSLEEPPTAIFSSNNMTTYGCLKAFLELGLTVGRDISLFGFDDIDALKWLNYKLSVVSRDAYEMGRRAMGLLADCFDREGFSEVGRRESLPTELILRGSEQWPESL